MLFDTKQTATLHSGKTHEVVVALVGSARPEFAVTCSSMNDHDQTGRSDWIVAICSVVFDLDVGQQLESVYPTAAISESTATTVAFHSFPVSPLIEWQLGRALHSASLPFVQATSICTR